MAYKWIQALNEEEKYSLLFLLLVFDSAVFTEKGLRIALLHRFQISMLFKHLLLAL